MAAKKKRPPPRMTQKERDDRARADSAAIQGTDPGVVSTLSRLYSEQESTGVVQIVDEKHLEVQFPKVLRVSYSRIRKWRECHRQHWYRYVRKLRRRKKGVPLVLGSAVHECIEALHNEGTYTGALERFRKMYNKLFNEEKADLGDLPGNVEKIMARYVEFYGSDGLVYPIRRRQRATEIPIRFWIDNRTEFIAYLDAYPQDKRRLNWLMDHKVPKRIPDEDSRFSDYQFAIYVWAVPQIGLPEPNGILWDYVKQTPPKVPGTNKDGTISLREIDSDYKTFMAEVHRVIPEKGITIGKRDPKVIKRSDYEDFASKLPGGKKFGGAEDPFFVRIPLPNPSKTLVRNTVDDFMRSVEEIRAFGPTASDRNPTRMCKSCEYFNLCAAELRGLDTDFMLKADYVEKGHHGKDKAEDGSDDDEG